MVITLNRRKLEYSLCFLVKLWNLTEYNRFRIRCSFYNLQNADYR